MFKLDRKRGKELYNIGMKEKLCEANGMWQGMCRPRREAYLKGTISGFDKKNDYCVLADNDEMTYFAPIARLLQTMTVAELLLNLQAGKAVFKRNIGCAERGHMLRRINRRIKKVEAMIK